MVHKIHREVVSHLEEDSEFWGKLAKDAKKEETEDKKLIKKLKRVGICGS